MNIYIKKNTYGLKKRVTHTHTNLAGIGVRQSNDTVWMDAWISWQSCDDQLTHKELDQTDLHTIDCISNRFNSSNSFSYRFANLLSVYKKKKKQNSLHFSSSIFCQVYFYVFNKVWPVQITGSKLMYKLYHK